MRGSMRTIVKIAIAAALVAAIQLLPALDFTRDSVRSEPFEFRVVSNWSMPLVRPMEMFLPALFRHLTNESGVPAISTMYPFRSDAYISEMYLGRLDTAAMQPIARCGYSDYAVVDKVISIVRPCDVPIIKTNAAE